MVLIELELSIEAIPYSPIIERFVDIDVIEFAKDGIVEERSHLGIRVGVHGREENHVWKGKTVLREVESTLNGGGSYLY